MATQWVYEPSADGTARFVLGTVGEHPLICFGINPSTAKPGALDPTVTRVARFAADNGFDSWTMLNVYPQISTDPKGLHTEPDPDLIAQNERHIAAAVGAQRAPLLAAWGGLVTSRPYLPAVLRSIVRVAADAGCTWASLGAPTKLGHPRHPLYLPAATPLQPFDMGRYLT